jgi:hypothetical protein
VELKSPNLIGTKVGVTDSNGEFRFSLLAPGVYSLSASLTGYAPLSQERIEVGLGRTVSLELNMRPSSVTETITVTADAPVVDVTSAATGANVTAETIRTLPLRRDFYAVAQVAPGTSGDASGTTVYGSTGAENQYIIDGLNTTGVELGTEGKVLNFDFIQEVAVKTGGLPAEYGRITGGVIEAITKSGGNEFHGGIFGYAQPESLRSDDATLSERPGTTASVASTEGQKDFGFDVGGYILKDRLWFFGAYDKVSQTNITIPVLNRVAQPTTSLNETDIKRDIYAGKLTWLVTGNHTLSAAVFGDPDSREGVLFPIAGPPSTYLGAREVGADDYVARYQGVFGSTFLVNALYGLHQESDQITGPGTATPLSLDQTVSPNTRTGGYGLFQNQEFSRDTLKLDLTKFIGSHELKVGGDMEKLSAVNSNVFSGNGTTVRKIPRPTVAGGPPVGTPQIYRHIYYVDDSGAGFVRTNPATWAIQYPLNSEPETENTSAYIQDSWRVLPYLTLNAGVRWEEQSIIGRNGETAIALDNGYSPRLGLIWDVSRNGRSKFYANFGRFYETVPMDINIRAFGGEVQADVYNFSPDPNNITQEPTLSGFNGTRARLLGGATTPVDPDLEGQYIDESLVGFEYEARPNLVLGVKGTYRNLGQVIEDMLIIDEGNYFISNPGTGIGKEVTFYDYSKAPAPEAERKYMGVEVSARKRFSNNYQFFASYLWSRLEGNYDGVFQVSTGQLDPNINSAYDYGDFSINNDGPLSNDRTHQLKFNGSYTFSAGMVEGLNLGLSTYWASGAPLTAFGYSNGYRNWEYFLTERGALGRGPDDYEADFHVGYPIRLGSSMRLNVIADIFNILDRQSATAVDTRYNRVSDGACSGLPVALCNHDGGILNIPGTTRPAGQLTNVRASAPNPDFLTAGTAFTGARTFRLGIRFEF